MYNSIYPGYANYYPGLNNRQIKQKQDEEKTPRQTKDAENTNGSDGANQGRNQSLNKQSDLMPSMPRPSDLVFPNGEKTAIDYTKKQIQIGQVLTDFRNTANAIGTPNDIKEEVEAYLSLVQKQADKNNPNVQIIQANLKNASKILDEYITNTLQKPSKVVETWVDTLFLQQIDYKSNSQAQKIQNNETADKIQELIAEEPTPEEPVVEEKPEPKKAEFYVPQNPELKDMFISAKLYSANDYKEEALSAFQDVVDYAQATGDVQTAALAYLEQGKLFDEFDRVEDALYSYNRAATDTQDNNVKARAHISMAKIYDDYVKFEPAVDHYAAAVSYSGESDNLKLQTKALTNLGKIYTGRYDRTKALNFMDMAETIASETKNDKLIGLTDATNAQCCEKLNENARAIQLYAKSAQAFHGINYYEGLADDYVKAGDLMLQFGNSSKAKNLYSKAHAALKKCDNPELTREVLDKMASL